MAELAQAEPTSTAASTEAEATPQLDTENVTLDQLETLFTTGKAELPHTVGGEETKQEAAAVETVVETRSAEEIETAKASARTASAEAGGDEAAQEVAAAEAAEPIAVPEVPVPAAPAPAIPDDEEIQGIQRPRLKNPVDQQIAAVFKGAEAAGTPISWAEAERRVKGDPPAKVEDVVQPDLAETVGTLETEVADLKAKLTAAGAEEGLYTLDIAKLNQDLVEKTADLKEAQRDLRQATQQSARDAAERKTASETALATSRAEAIAEYPDIAKADSELAVKVKAEIAALRDPKHPDHTILFADSAPLVIAQKVARKLGIAPVAKQAASPPAKPKVVAPPTPVASPVSGAKTTVKPGVTQEDAKTAVEDLKTKGTLADLDDVFGAGDLGQTLSRVVA